MSSAHPYVQKDVEGEQTSRRYCWNKMSKKQFICSICCLGCSVVTMIFLLVLFLAIIPGMAQDAVDASRIEVRSMSITASTPDSMTMVMEFDAWNTYPLAAKLKSSEVDVEFEGKKVGSMTMPELELEAHSKTSFSKELVMVLAHDRSGFNNYAAALMTRPEITMYMKGKVDVVSMGLSYGVNLDSEVSVKGFNNFNSVVSSRRLSDDGLDVPRPVLTSMDFTDEDVAPGTVVAFGTSTLPNPSQVEVANSGRMFADVFAFGEKVGTAESTHDVAIKALGSIVSMRMVIEKSETNQQALREMFGNYVNGVETFITIQGTGGSKPEWAEPLKAMKVSIGVPGLVNEQDKMFVGVQQPLNFTAATTFGDRYQKSDLPHVDYDYCGKLFGDSANEKCDQSQNAGALMPVTAVVRNVLGMQVAVSDYFFSATIASEVPDFCRNESGSLTTSLCPTLQLDQSGGFNISGMDFGFTGKELARAGPYSGPSGHVPAAFQPKYPQPFVEQTDQRTITLAAKSMKMMGMTMASAVSPMSPTVTGLIYNYLMPTMMKIHGYSPFGTFYSGHDNVPFFVDMSGYGTMSTKSGFSIDKVKIEQKKVLTFMAFIQSGGNPSTEGPFLAGCPKNSPVAWGECQC